MNEKQIPHEEHIPKEPIFFTEKQPELEKQVRIRGKIEKSPELKAIQTRIEKLKKGLTAQQRGELQEIIADLMAELMENKEIEGSQIS